MTHRIRLALRLTLTTMTLLPLAAAMADSLPETTFRALRQHTVPEARQAVAVDVSSFYAITNRAIARYDKLTAKPLAKWTADAGSPIEHLNSGIVIDGRLYCANSNWPKSPLRNSIEIFEAESLRHLDRRAFAEAEGAINWIDRHAGAWWVVFAFYGEAEVRRTRLVRYDDQWQETGRWTFPETVVERFLPNSNSGGAFGPNGKLYVTGHDHAEIYVLEVPSNSGELRYVETVAAPIAGQGIAWDRSDIGVLYGIVRKHQQVVAMRLSHSQEYAELKRPVEWLRDPRNPILPPREGKFDSTRCMNPWIVETAGTYRLYYAGGDNGQTHRIGMAEAAVDNPAEWRRQGPLFETGAEEAFDARWCVLPHVVRIGPQRWHLYYTGNSGRGTGLSAFPGIGLATSEDGITWHRSADGPVITPSGEHGTPDAIGIAGGSLISVPNADGRKEWRFYYTGCPTMGEPHALNQQKTICLAVSTDGRNWQKRGAIMLRDPHRDYEDIGIAGPVVHQDDDGLFRMWYSAIGTRWGYYSICYAESDDGIHWRRGRESEDNLQLTPTGDGWEKQMVEYPAVIREGDHLRLFYCGNGYGRTGIGTAVSKGR